LPFYKLTPAAPKPSFASSEASYQGQSAVTDSVATAIVSERKKESKVESRSVFDEDDEVPDLIEEYTEEMAPKPTPVH